MDDIYDDEDDLATRIKQFLSRDSSFRDAAFDPSPYLLKVLKDKQANQQLLVEKQTELIQLENQAKDLIEQIALDRSQSFMQLLSVPQQFGQQLQKLKHSMANVKRKVKQTKTLLLMTQKDIQQIHLNCVFNKLIYRRIKEVELKLNQYETASLALKNHLYLECAQNLPVFQGNSVLQNALAVRAQNLKLRFLSQAIQQIRLFLYFTPRLSLPTSHRFIDNSEANEQIFNEAAHESFYKRYLLFKRAKCNQYLSSIWQLNVLQQKSGRVGIMHDIINGIIRIGKTNQITDSLSLDAKKSINNIFLVLTYFFSKQFQEEDKSNKAVRWLTDPQEKQHTTFLSVLFCVSAALLRKMIIIRRICAQYQLTEVCSNLSSSNILSMVREQIFDLIKSIYFPQRIAGMGYQLVQHDLISRLGKIGDYKLWPYLKKIIESCFQILVAQLAQVEKQAFSLDFPEASTFIKPFQMFQRKFLDMFHQQFMKTMQQIFPQGRGFNLQSLDSVLSSRCYSADELQFCARYASEDKKTIKQFFNMISLLNSLKRYFLSNDFQPTKYKQYIIFLMVFFYMKLNSIVYRFMISPIQYDKLMEVRIKDAKVKNKEKHFEQRYESIVASRADSKLKTQRKHFKHQEGDHPQLRNIEQLKMFRIQIEMWLFYATNHFQQLQQVIKQAEVDKFEGELEKHEPSNYDENVNSKLVRMWEQLIKPLDSMNNSLNCLQAALFRKIIDLYLNISAYVYIQTGIY